MSAESDKRWRAANAERDERLRKRAWKKANRQKLHRYPGYKAERARYKRNWKRRNPKLWQLRKKVCRTMLRDNYIRQQLKQAHKPITHENIERTRTQILAQRSKRFFRAFATGTAIAKVAQRSD